MTQGGSLGSYGDRTPCLFLTPLRDEFYIASAVNGAVNYRLLTKKGLTVNVGIKIEIHQRYTSGGKYRYFIKINGEEIHSIVNNDAQQFYNVKVYASNPWDPIVCPGYIKNFAITNLL